MTRPLTAILATALLTGIAAPAFAKDDAAVNSLYQRYEEKESDYYAGKTTMEETLRRKEGDYTPDVIWAPPFESPLHFNRESLLKLYEENTRPLKERGGRVVSLQFRVVARKWLGDNDAIDAAYAKTIFTEQGKQPRTVYLTVLTSAHKNSDGTWSWQAGSSNRTTPEAYEQARPIPGGRFDN